MLISGKPFENRVVANSPQKETAHNSLGGGVVYHRVPWRKKNTITT